MQTDAQLQKLTKELEALEALMAPPDKGPLKKELDSYAKLLVGPSLGGTDGRGKGIPSDILKAHKDGTAFIAATRAKYKV